MVIMLGLVVLAVGVLVPTVGTYLAQQQKLSAARAAVQLTQQQIDALQAESDRLGDPAYIATQARERLYYVTPGQVLYLVDNDLPADQQPRERAAHADPQRLDVGIRAIAGRRGGRRDGHGADRRIRAEPHLGRHTESVTPGVYRAAPR